jgi:hypothetical protein
VQVLGTTPENIDFAEDRQKHSAMLDTLGIDQVRLPLFFLGVETNEI